MCIRFTQQAQSLDSDLETPVGLFIRLVGESPGILLESAEIDGKWGRFSLIATDFVLSAASDAGSGALALKMADPRLQSLPSLQALAGRPFVEGLRELMSLLHIDTSAMADAAAYAPITRALYGYLGYGVAGMFEPKLADVLPAADAEASLVLPGTLVVFDHTYNRISRLTLCLDGEKVLALPPENFSTKTSKPAPELAGLVGSNAYTAAVSAVKAQIREGEAIQVVLSTPFSAPLTESPFALYRRLRRINPSPYLFYMRLPGMNNGVLLGSSPEVLVSCAANRLQLCPIAGTRPRSRDLAEDMLFGDELLQDPKEKAEHVMLVDLGRNDLGRIATAGSVVLERFMEVERFSHVMHLTSRIKADLLPGLGAMDVLAATFPAGTVSGAPKVRAMEIIAEQEGAPRGPYAGAIGWMSLDKDAVHLDFGIVIRSLWVKDGQVCWQAGAGIVHDSVAEKEWQECCAKAAVIRKVVFGDELLSADSATSPIQSSSSGDCRVSTD